MTDPIAPSTAPLPAAVIKRPAPHLLWLVWLIPLLAVVIGAWIGVRTIVSKGPTVTIAFRNAEGLEAGKTKIRYKDVDIGLVKSIRLSPDYKGVVITAELRRFDNVDALLVADTRFWVVRPQVSAGGISGLSTLLSGAYIGLDIGRGQEAQDHFTGLEVPPIVTADLPGKQFMLNAQNLGSLGVGSPVYFRRVTVGQVVAYDLAPNGKEVAFTIFVNAPYHHFVTQRARFWHASGVDFSLNADGVRVNTESLSSVLSGGGIAFQEMGGVESAGGAGAMDTPEASSEASFTLHEDRAQALKQPDVFGHDYVLMFPSSVRGLSVGAPVDFRGLSIGEVTAINLEALPSAKNPTPPIAVTMRIYPNRLPTLAKTVVADSSTATARTMLNPMVAKGFRAQLRSGNLITGQMLVTLDFFERTPLAKIDWAHNPPVFPTIPGSLDGIQGSVASIADKLDHLPLDLIASDLRETLKTINQTVLRADSVVQQVGTDITPEARKMLEDARKTMTDVSAMLASIDKTVSLTLGPDAPLPAQTANTLADISKAAKALRATADYLERHPETLLRGKPEDKK